MLPVHCFFIWLFSGFLTTGPEMPIEPIVIMPEDTEGDRLSSQGTTPVLSPQIELGSPMRTATPPPEASTDGRSREERQLFSTETDLYGSPGVAFTVKKTGVTYGTPSPPRKCGEVLDRRSSVRSVTSMSETSDNEVNLPCIESTNLFKLELQCFLKSFWRIYKSFYGVIDAPVLDFC